ncbi:hypothetical protein D3C72_2220960 [compost metagenome]
MTCSAISLGIKLSTSQRCRVSCSRPKLGNAVKTDSSTVKNGTKASKVVNVRLLAVKPSWSSLKRVLSVCKVLRHGKDLSVFNKWCMRDRARCKVRAMPRMMPPR